MGKMRKAGGRYLRVQTIRLQSERLSIKGVPIGMDREEGRSQIRRYKLNRFSTLLCDLSHYAVLLGLSSKYLSRCLYILSDLGDQRIDPRKTLFVANAIDKLKPKHFAV